MSGLRDALAAALTDPGKCEHPGGESCDQWWRADAALAVVAQWLLDEAGDIQAEHGGDVDGHHDPIVEHLRWLADSLTHTTGQETRT